MRRMLRLCFRVGIVPTLSRDIRVRLAMVKIFSPITWGGM